MFNIWLLLDHQKIYIFFELFNPPSLKLNSASLDYTNKKN